MEITTSTARRISQAAWIMAAVGTVVGQVHALARAQAHPNDSAESPLARAWGEPATRAFRPLLGWSDPWTVYITYGKIWLPVCLAFTAAAFLVYRRRSPVGAERRLWQVALAGYAAMTMSVFGDYFTPWMDQMFILGVAAMLVIGFGGIPLGIVMLRNGFRPRITPILLTVFIPLMLAITEVTSLGSALLPLMWGWAIAAHTAAAHPGTPSTPRSWLAPTRHEVQDWAVIRSRRQDAVTRQPSNKVRRMHRVRRSPSDRGSLLAVTAARARVTNAGSAVASDDRSRPAGRRGHAVGGCRPQPASASVPGAGRGRESRGVRPPVLLAVGG